MNLTTTVAPLADPISLAEAKNHLGVDTTDLDTKITALIASETQRVEAWLRRALITRTNVLRLDRFPRIIMPPDSSPLRAVTSIAYNDTNGDAQTWASSYYTVDRYSEPARIHPAFGQVYPATREDYNAVTVTYTCGYATRFTAATTDLITAPGHLLSDGDSVELSMSGPEGCALPAGLAENTTYYARDVVAGVSLKLAATSGGAAIDITGTGTGTGAQFYLGVVPRPIRQAILLMVGLRRVEGSPVNVGNIVSEIPLTVDYLLAPYRVLQF